MPVILTSPVEGLERGDTYEGPNEAWLLENGYAAAIDPDDIPDLDHLVGADYPAEVVERNDDATPSKQAYGPEVALETTVQSADAEARLDQIRSTKPEYSSDPKPEPEPEPEPEDPGDGEEE